MTRKHLPSALAAALISAVMLCGCETPAPTENFPEMTFQHLPALKLDVATIEKAAAIAKVPPQEPPITPILSGST